MAAARGNDAETMKRALDYLQRTSAAGFGHEDGSGIYKVIQ